MTVIAWPEDRFVTQGDIDIGLSGSQIMQRWLARRIFREIEFSVRQSDGAEVVGYITGFDDRCLQMSTSPVGDEEPRSVLVFWPIARIEETGRRIDDLDHVHRSKIRSYSHALRMICESSLSARKKPQEERRPGR